VNDNGKKTNARRRLTDVIADVLQFLYELLFLFGRHSGEYGSLHEYPGQEHREFISYDRPRPAGHRETVITVDPGFQFEIFSVRTVAFRHGRGPLHERKTPAATLLRSNTCEK